MNPRNFIAAFLTLPAIGAVLFGCYLLQTGATAATYTDPLLLCLIATIFTSLSIWLRYGMPTRPDDDIAPPRPRNKNCGFSMVEVLVVISIVVVVIGTIGATLTGSFRNAIKPRIDDKMREAAVIQMYESKSITADDVYMVAAKAEWARRGFLWSDATKPYTPANVAAELELLFPGTGPTPAFEVPAWTSRQAVIDMGLTEPDPKATFGMNN